MAPLEGIKIYHEEWKTFQIRFPPIIIDCVVHIVLLIAPTGGGGTQVTDDIWWPHRVFNTSIIQRGFAMACLCTCLQWPACHGLQLWTSKVIFLPNTNQAEVDLVQLLGSVLSPDYPGLPRSADTTNFAPTQMFHDRNKSKLKGPCHLSVFLKLRPVFHKACLESNCHLKRSMSPPWYFNTRVCAVREEMGRQKRVLNPSPATSSPMKSFSFLW